jgi:hypothetical protein
MKRGNLFGIIFCVLLTNSPFVLAYDSYLERVVIEDSIDTDHSTPDTTQTETAVVGYVGKIFHASIKYEIGFFHSDLSNGASEARQVSNLVPNPEYMYFCRTDASCDLGEILGLTFDKNTGLIDGVPSKAGRLAFYPAVRDKYREESSFPDRGFFWTKRAKYGGKTWIRSVKPVIVMVLPPPDPSRIDLQCTISSANFTPLQISIDYQSGYALILGIDGVLSGIYKLNNAADDILGWSGMPWEALKSIDTRSSVKKVSLNRSNGVWIVETEQKTYSGHCEKRSTTRLF